MKRILCLMLCVSLFTSTLFGIKKDVEASTVVIGGAGYVTAEAVFGVVCTCLMMAGIIEEADNVDLLDYLANIFEPDYPSPEEVEEYVQQQITCMENVLDELIANNDMFPDERGYAWIILCSAPTIAEGCVLLANAINDARAKGCGLDGEPLETNSNGVPTADSIKNGATAIQDSNTNAVIVSPSIVNSLVNDIENIVNASESKYSSFSQSVTSTSSYNIVFTLNGVNLDIDINGYGSTYDLCSRYVNDGGGYLISHGYNASYCEDVYTLYLWDSTTSCPRIYKDGFGMLTLDVSYNMYLSFNASGVLRGRGTTSTKTSLYTNNENSLGVQYYSELTFADGFSGALPSSWTIDRTGKVADIVDVSSSSLVDYYDIDDGSSSSIVDDLVVVPSIDDIIEGTANIIVDNGGIPHDTAQDCIIKGIVNDIPKEVVVPYVSDDVANVLDDSETYTGVTDSDSDSSPPTVDTGWEWLDDLLNAILAVLFDIWTAITGIVTGIVDGILNGMKTLLQWLLDGTVDILKFLFVPEAGYVNSQVDEVLQYFTFFEKIIDTGKDIGNFFTNEEPEPPSIVVDFTKSDSDINYGGKTVIKFDWYAKYKEDFDDIISAFLWAVFVWNMFKSIPSVINGAGVIGTAKSRVNKSEAEGSEDE